MLTLTQLLHERGQLSAAVFDEDTGQKKFYMCFFIEIFLPFQHAQISTTGTPMNIHL